MSATAERNGSDQSAYVLATELQLVAQDAHDFVTNSLEAYKGSRLLAAEERAAVMYLALLAMGANNGTAGILIGVPGGGKSRLLEHGHMVIDGIEDEDIAAIEHRIDLTPAQVVGDNTSMKRSGTLHGESYEEHFTAEVEAILRSGKKIIKLDEITRGNPFALNAMLKILQDGRINTIENGQVKSLDDLDLVISSMNNHGTRYTNDLDPAVVARHAMGAFMGSREKGQLSEAGRIMVEEDEDFNEIPQIDGKHKTSYAKLHDIRSYIPKVPLSPDAIRLLREKIPAMLDFLSEEVQLDIGDGRTITQTRKIARTLALFRGRSMVMEPDIYESIGYGMTAKMGAVDHFPQHQVDEAIYKITGGHIWESYAPDGNQPSHIRAVV